MKSKSILFAALMVAMIPVSAGAAVLASIGDVVVNEDRVKAEYDQATPDQKTSINKDEATRRQLVDSYINTEVLVLAAKKSGLEKDPEYLRALERFQRQYLATKFVQKSIEPRLTKAELQKFFEGNKGFFDSTQVCAHHIVVTKQEDAAALAAKARAKGANFEELAMKNSIDPTVQENKGNLGCFSREKMVPEFSAAAFGMAKGQVSDPIRTMYGFHVIKVADIKAGKVPGFEEVEQRVKEHYRMKLLSDLVKDLRAKSKVKVNDGEVRNFKL